MNNRVKRLVIPALTLFFIVAQASPTFAVTTKEVAEFMQESPTVVLEIYEPRVYATNQSENFEDVSESLWYYNDVKNAKRLGLIKGVGNNKYAPDREITNAEYITAIVRIFHEDSTISDFQDSTHWSDK